MKNKKSTRKLSHTVASVLETVLKTEANSTSCAVFYQPKAPEKLSRYRKEK